MTRRYIGQTPIAHGTPHAPTRTMRSKVTIRGRAVHPMLVKFPIGLYVAGYAALLAYVVIGDAFWYRAAYVSMFGGVAFALVAATIGAIDYVNIPRDTRAKEVAAMHAFLAVAATVFFAASAFSLRGEYVLALAGGPVPLRIPLVFSTLGTLVLLAAGVLGWQMLYAHHIGVSPVPGRGDRVQLVKPLTRERGGNV
jgi:uncharacterized membrane protein